MRSNIFRTFAILLITIFSFAVIAQAQTSPSHFDGVKIDNFGQMDPNYYRGAQPRPDDYKSLANLGVKTIIDLRNDPTDYEKSAAEAVGIKYVNIPMSGWKSPQDEDIARFLKLMDDPATGTVFVHCKAGIHRTGITGAIYRMEKDGWDYDKSYGEMKNYNFSTGLVHGALKSYVRKYAAKMGEQHAAPSAVTPVASN